METLNFTGELLRKPNRTSHSHDNLPINIRKFLNRLLNGSLEHVAHRSGTVCTDYDPIAGLYSNDECQLGLALEYAVFPVFRVFGVDSPNKFRKRQGLRPIHNTFHVGDGARGGSSVFNLETIWSPSGVAEYSL